MHRRLNHIDFTRTTSPFSGDAIEAFLGLINQFFSRTYQLGRIDFELKGCWVVTSNLQFYSDLKNIYSVRKQCRA